MFLYTYVRKEAVLSSQIQGTQSSLSDLLWAELDDAPGVPLDDVTEVSDYVAALETLGVVRETTGWRRGRICSYDACLKILAEGREPL